MQHQCLLWRTLLFVRTVGSNPCWSLWVLLYSSKVLRRMSVLVFHRFPSKSLLDIEDHTTYSRCEKEILHAKILIFSLTWTTTTSPEIPYDVRIMRFKRFEESLQPWLWCQGQWLRPARMCRYSSRAAGDMVRSSKSCKYFTPGHFGQGSGWHSQDPLMTIIYEYNKHSYIIVV